MNELDLRKEPPTEAKLEAHKAAMNAELAALTKAGIRARWGLIGGAVLGTAVLAWMTWLQIRFPGEWWESAISVSTAVVLAGVMAAGSRVSSLSAGCITVAVFAAASLALVGLGGLGTGGAVIVAAMSIGGGGLMGCTIGGLGILAGLDFDEQTETLEECLRKLQPVGPTYSAEVARWCQLDGVVARYQQAIAAQGRMLVEGEYAAMKHQVGKTPHRTRADRQRRPDDALHKHSEATA